MKNKSHIQRLIAIANHLEKLNSLVAITTRWGVLIMIGIGTWNVIGRYLGVFIGYNLSSNSLIEAQWYLFSFIFLFGLSWTLQKKGHVRVDILEGLWKDKRKLKVEFLGTILLLLPFSIGVMIISINPALQSWQINELSPDPNGLPRYLIKTLIPLGFLLLTLQGISDAIKSYSKIKFKEIYNKTIRGNKS